MNVPIELVIIGQQQVELVQLKMENAALLEKVKALAPKAPLSDEAIEIIKAQAVAE